jgi:hypothetical protein
MIVINRNSEVEVHLNTGQWVVMIIAGILILSFILGYYYNRQQAESIFRWLKQGLSTLGEVSLGEKLPGMATGGRLEVNQPAAPLKRVEAVYLLAPRENPLFMLFHLLQRRSDELIVWINYQSKPEQSIEVARPGDRQFDKRLQEKEKPALSIIESFAGLQLAVETVPGSTQLKKVQAFLSKYPSSVIRLALHPDKPHLFLRLTLHRLRNSSSAELFTALVELAG